ncbi:hypothetical protein AYY19_08470 [Photobacterium aquimaris]|nr:hypothetical protein AYY19_08470 [Photobacterium aquimaris]
MKIVYIVSNLRRTGPVNQLFYILSNLNKERYEIKIITLSPEPKDSKYSQYVSNGYNIECLSLSRISGVIKGKEKIKKILFDFKPDIIQTQGIRADGLVSSLDYNDIWITTSRNFPCEDYPSKFGFIKGWMMARKHCSILSKCKNLISCSNTIAIKLSNIGIKSHVITNGVPVNNNYENKKTNKELTLTSVGSLIPRKNMGYLIDLISELNLRGVKLNLNILGDGFLMNELKKNAPSNVNFLGNVDNVDDYLSGSSLFLSSSLSEGLPNTVLEAVTRGVPVILSEIDSHLELVKRLPPNSYYIFSLDLEPKILAESIVNEFEKLSKINRRELSLIASYEFSSESMSKQYQQIYEGILNCQKTFHH